MDAVTLKTTYIYEHYSRAALRLLFCLAVSNSLMEFTAMLIFIGATFDNTLNLMRGKEFLHLGTTALWDRLWTKVKGLYIAFIVAALIVSVYILIMV